MLGINDYLWCWYCALHILRWVYFLATLTNNLISLFGVFGGSQAAYNALHFSPNRAWCRSNEEYNRTNGDNGLAIDAREFDSTWQLLANVAPSIIIAICKWLNSGTSTLVDGNSLLIFRATVTSRTPSTVNHQLPQQRYNSIVDFLPWFWFSFHYRLNSEKNTIRFIPSMQKKSRL